MDKIIKLLLKMIFLYDKDEDDDGFYDSILFMKLPGEESLREIKITDFIKEKYGDELYVHFRAGRILVRTIDMEYRDAICFDIRDFYEHVGISVEEARKEDICVKVRGNLAGKLGYLSYKVNKMAKLIRGVLLDDLTLEPDDKELEDEIDVENIVERYKERFKELFNMEEIKEILKNKNKW